MIWPIHVLIFYAVLYWCKHWKSTIYIYRNIYVYIDVYIEIYMYCSENLIHFILEWSIIFNILKILFKIQFFISVIIIVRFDSFLPIIIIIHSVLLFQIARLFLFFKNTLYQLSKLFLLYILFASKFFL